MMTLIQRERLAETFTQLCEISSPSRREKEIADHLKQVFTDLGANAIIEDNSATATGSESGNLIFRFDGNRPDVEGVFFSCHMDTVQPGDGVEVDRKGDIFTSRGETILGGDDKSGIAAIIEMMTLLTENNIDHGLIEIVITTCEEIGLLGAKHLEHRLLKAKYGYALDSSGIDKVIIGAPSANKFKIIVTGAAAHAGLNPEQGISAIQVAAEAITKVQLGRLDEESTANFGIIGGGVATNIVPEQVTIEGEVRSHSSEKLAHYTAEIKRVFEATVADWQTSPENTLRPKVQIEALSEYPAMLLSMDSPVIRRVRSAGESIGKNINFVVAGGGSDANIFNGFGLPTAIIATGMDKVHTTDEQLDLNDLVSVTELISTVAVQLTH
ncbi:M20/M25/M40 family metallo-hydrolase [Desulfopila aestuarii]|uniref:Peptidase T-like protein n=1 Tax=Desulfopila aestuarii DSM 18488 TaxID=1121416 RepID=A0A1M7YCS6_9BACT|nr:M20/M25/M40 family metallo-hydrolase [Desulfopila aestuarii]SHO50413.1 peptidase T-like protein [Desulfopila aestuarii DSM 18488]